MRMHQFVLAIVALALSASVAFAGGDTEFNYQGRLLDAGEPANGTFNVDFRLWDDPLAGNQVDATNTFNSLPILEGLFTVELDFGANAFDNNDRWLEITVDGVPLVPRQPITRAPYAIQTRGIFVDAAGDIGIGTNTPNATLHIETDSNIGIRARNYSTSHLQADGGSFNSSGTNGRGVVGSSSSSSLGGCYGGWFTCVSPSGTGVYGLARSDTGTTYGGRFESESTSGRGVLGEATADSGNTYGVYGFNRSTSGHGVFGWATANTGTTCGGRFESESTSGRGVLGEATAASGNTFGVYGLNNSTSGRGVLGHATASTGTTYGVYGVTNSESGRGVLGKTTSATGTTYGGRFESESTSGFAGYFEGNGGDAVYIENVGAGRGLHAVAPSDTAVWAQTTTGFAGVHGANAAASGRGVYGQASGTSGTNYGVYGASSSASGFDFYAGGAGVNYGASSSRRWKNNVTPIGDPLYKLSKLQGVYFDWDEELGGAHDVGMIAEEVGTVLPEIVQYEANGVDAIGMDYSKMTPLLVEAVNALRAEQAARIESLRAEKDAEIATLMSKAKELTADNNRLATRLEELEQAVQRLASK